MHDPTTTQRTLNDREAGALRAYMHDLDRQAAILEGANPDLICPRCGFDGNEATDPDTTTHDTECR